MTTTPSDGFRLCTRYDALGAVRVEMRGDLDHTSADTLLDTVVELLAEYPDASELRLDCAPMGTVDSSGLAALIMIRRRTDEAGVALRLDGRGAALDRLLEVTGTLDHLTTTPMDAERTPGRTARTTSETAHEVPSAIDGVRSRSARPPGPDGTA
ncbi:STAS domain-containing protein [Streptomyces sp. NBC_00102]|uniref:STAS domain-containing protein n=1 Tax=Streptomyces sp. NBC_00102 TaxID=2975652 RepID=UPI002256727D|nr:STAS domain-containing protein [Streptomyces sp. NBC_00102]MCX5401280.1 STAS domain-containing protein [Streptomyces sp. NBC_00102]